MTEPTINLQKGCELWADFSPRYYDNQRNTIQDRSGYGRDLVASGGVNITSDGFDNYGAVGFDGTDDTLYTNDVSVSDHNTVGVDEGMTIAAKVKLSDEMVTTDRYFLNYGGNKISFRCPSDTENIYFICHDEQTNQFQQTGLAGERFNEWITLFGMVDEANDKIYGEIRNDDETFLAGGDFSGDIVRQTGFGLVEDMEGVASHISLWGRLLTEAEREQVARLTGPPHASI